MYSPATLIALALVSLFTSALTAVAALGGGAVMIAMLLIFLPPAIAIPLQGMIQIVGASGRISLMYKHISWPIVWRVAALLAPGAAVGIYVFRGVSQNTIGLMIGVFVLLTLFSKQIRFFGDRELPLWCFIPLGFVIGAMSVTVAVVAMFTAPFLLRKDLNKQSINVTMAAIAVLGHFTKVVAFGAIGFRPQDHIAPFLVMVPSVLLGTFFGERVLRRLSENVFRWIFRFSLGALALKLVVWDTARRLLFPH